MSATTSKVDGVLHLTLCAMLVGKWGLDDYEFGMMCSFLAKTPVLRTMVG
ncbi:hypothetical protein [Adlercreutzia sp. ZJ141]|nr:hypothetical protein [Adlercreutzia sp. ZJ141]